MTENRADDWWRRAQRDLKPAATLAQPPIDLLSDTPEEWQRLRAHPTPLVWAAMEEGVVGRRLVRVAQKSQR